jgi:hypothetical protein
MTLTVLAVLWFAWVVLGITFELTARRRLAALQHRILVSGWRGKTTLVRLIHVGLSASGITTVGRVSGDQPKVIGIDGIEEPVRRWGPANIRELRRIPTSGAQAVVVENMAIKPELQAVVAHRCVCPTIAVLAPDALDHLEDYPAHQETRAHLTLETLPARVSLIAPAESVDPATFRCAQELGLTTTAAPVCNEDGLRPYMRVLAGMALEAVAQVAGESNAKVRNAVLAAAKRLQRITVYRRNGVFWVDGMSANDPCAARQLAETTSREAEQRALSVGARLFNHRADRASRLPLFSGLLDHGGPSWIIGSPVLPRWKHTINATRLTGTPETIVRSIEGQLGNQTAPAYVLCLGNTAGVGRALRQWLSAHAEVESW